MHDWSAKHVVLVHPDDPDRRILEEQLRSLGAVVTSVWPVPERVDDGTNALLLYISQPDEPRMSVLFESFGGVCLAIVNPDQPSAIRALAGYNVHGVLVRPHIRGALQAELVVAATNYGYAAKLRVRIAHLEANLRSRRVIEKATQLLVRTRGLTEAAAYEALRNEAMKRRLAIGALAQDLVAGHARANLATTSQDQKSSVTDVAVKRAAHTTASRS